jgi:hypothetical protein
MPKKNNNERATFPCEICNAYPFDHFRPLRNHYERHHGMWINSRDMVPYPIRADFREQARQIVLNSEISSAAHRRRLEAGYVPQPRQPPFRPPMPSGFAERHGLRPDPEPRSRQTSGSDRTLRSRDASDTRSRAATRASSGSRAASRAWDSQSPATAASSSSAATRARSPMSPAPAHRRGVARLPPAEWLGGDSRREERKTREQENKLEEEQKREQRRERELKREREHREEQEREIERRRRQRPAPSAALGAEGQVTLSPALSRAAALTNVLAATEEPSRPSIDASYQRPACRPTRWYPKPAPKPRIVPTCSAPVWPTITYAPSLASMTRPAPMPRLEPEPIAPVAAIRELPYPWPRAEAIAAKRAELDRLMNPDEPTTEPNQYPGPDILDTNIIRSEPGTTMSPATRAEVRRGPVRASFSQYLEAPSTQSPAPPLRFQPLTVKTRTRTTSSSSEEEWYNRMREEMMTITVRPPTPPMPILRAATLEPEIEIKLDFEDAVEDDDNNDPASDHSDTVVPFPLGYQVPRVIDDEPEPATKPYDENEDVTNKFIEQLLELELQRQSPESEEDMNMSLDLFPSLDFEEPTVAGVRPKSPEDQPWLRAPLPDDDGDYDTDVYYEEDDDVPAPAMAVDPPISPPLLFRDTPVLAPVVPEPTQQLQRAYRPTIVFVPVPVYIPVIIVQNVSRDRSRSPLRRTRSE